MRRASVLSVPFALVGGVWLMWALDYNVSVAVIVGFIALAGVAAEIGVVMLIYLDHALEARAAQRQVEGRSLDARDLRRSEEHTSELQSLMRISYAVLCLKKNKTTV